MPTGVMRFLQSEWHRHERERNSWDIEKQEMKARIAQLEGKLKRGDATQNASKKYITILQRKIKEQSAQLAGQGKWDPAHEIAVDKETRSAMLQDKLTCKYQLYRPIPTIQRRDQINGILLCYSEGTCRGWSVHPYRKARGG